MAFKAWYDAATGNWFCEVGASAESDEPETGPNGDFVAGCLK